MTLPSSGTIKMSEINAELGRNGTDQISLDSAENGTYATINVASANRPSATNPANMSEWYSYNHDAKYSYTVQVMSTIYDCCGTQDTTKYSNCNPLALNCYIYNTNGSGSPWTYSVFYDGTYIWTANNGSGLIDSQNSCTC